MDKYSASHYMPRMSKEETVAAEAVLADNKGRAFESLGNDEQEALYEATKSLQRHDVQIMTLPEHLNKYTWLRKVKIKLCFKS